MVRQHSIPCVAFLVALASAVFAPPAHGQTITATLQGVVRDASQAALPGALVTVRERNTGLVRTATSDTAGSYVLSHLPAGTYDLTVELASFKTLRREGLRFQVGQETTLDVALEVGGVAETVTVQGETPLVEASRSSVGQNISLEQIAHLPLTGRQAVALALLVPGVVQRGTSTEEPVGGGGQPRGSGETLVDGVSTELMAVNSIRSTMPPDAVQEFQVITNQYQAEFGNATGVILNTITRSGTNDLHGRLHYFHRDEALDARNAFATTKASFEQKQAGGWLGGPISRDRTHYFVAYDATRRKQIAVVTSPAAPGDVEQPFDNNQLLAKVTHQFTSNHRLTGRFSLDRPVSDNVAVGGTILEEVGVKQLAEDLSYVANLTSILSNRALNDFRVQLSDSRQQLDPKQADVYTIIRPTSISGKLPNVPQAFPELRLQLADSYTYERGRHRMKAGIDFNRVVLGEGYVYQNVPGTFQFATDRPFNAADSTTFPVVFVGNQGDPTFRMVSTGIALFAQDAWHLPHNVTLNVGLRYDAWDVTGLDLEKANFAPRLAVAWDPFGTNKTVVRAGYGVFNNNVITNATLFTTFLSGQRSIQILNPGYPNPIGGVTVPQVLSTYIAQDDQPLPVAYHTTLGFQREIATGWSVGADYVNSRGRDLIRQVDTNPPQPPAYAARPDPTRGFVRILESTGYSDYDGLLVNFKGRVASRDMFQVAYTLSSYKTTTETDSNVLQQDDLNKDDSYGYGEYDQRHRFVFSGYVTLPWEIQLGGVLTARSGVPFNIITGTDNIPNGTVNDRPNLAPGATVNTDDMKDRASFVNPGRGFAGNLPRNAGRRPSYWTLDARLAKRFRFGARSIEGIVEAFNLTNRVNYNGFQNSLASSQFGTPNSAFDARQVQLGVRFEF